MKKYKILIVEDEQKILALTTDLLSDDYDVITATNVQDALEQLADQFFRSNEAPSASTTNLSEGDFFYDLNDNQLKVYRETSSGVFQFVPLSQATGDMETVDAGSF